MTQPLSRTQPTFDFRLKELARNVGDLRREVRTSPVGGSSAWGGITGILSNQTDLKAALDGKQVAGLYAAAVHGHAIANVTGLQGALDGKQTAGSYQPLASVLTNSTASFTAAQESKLAGIAAGASSNSPDATLLARGNHTGTQAAATISDFNATARAQTEAELVAGANVTITPSGSGATRQLTVSADSGGAAYGTATMNITTQRGVFEWSETIAAVGVSPANLIILGLGAHSDNDENCAELLDLTAFEGVPGTDTLTISAAFSSPTSGPIKFNWSAF